MSDDPSVPDEVIVGVYQTGDGRIHQWFDEGAALADLLLAEKVALNSRWWCDCDKEEIAVFINCNDVFAWGCSDAEALPFAEIERLWAMHRRDPVWGTDVWCMQRRKQMPQKPVEKSVRKQGIWDLDRMGLEPNTMNAEVQALVAHVAAKR